MERLTNSLGLAVVPTNSYSILYPGCSRIQRALKNLSAKTIKIQAKANVAKIAATNELPKLFASKNANINKKGDSDLEPLSLKDQRKLKEKLGLSGTDEWTQEEKDAVDKLFIDYGRLFVLDSNDLGYTNLVKHEIKLDNYTPFKEQYCYITAMYNCWYW